MSSTLSSYQYALEIIVLSANALRNVALALSIIAVLSLAVYILVKHGQSIKETSKNLSKLAEGAANAFEKQKVMDSVIEAVTTDGVEIIDRPFTASDLYSDGSRFNLSGIFSGPQRANVAATITLYKKDKYLSEDARIINSIHPTFNDEDGYNYSDKYNSLKQRASHGEVDRIGIFGPPATGKSHLANVLAMDATRNSDVLFLTLQSDFLNNNHESLSAILYTFFAELDTTMKGLKKKPFHYFVRIDEFDKLEASTRVSIMKQMIDFETKVTSIATQKYASKASFIISGNDKTMLTDNHYKQQKQLKDEKSTQQPAKKNNFDILSMLEGFFPVGSSKENEANDISEQDLENIVGPFCSRFETLHTVLPEFKIDCPVEFYDKFVNNVLRPDLESKVAEQNDRYSKVIGIIDEKNVKNDNNHSFKRDMGKAMWGRLIDKIISAKDFGGFKVVLSDDNNAISKAKQASKNVIVIDADKSRKNVASPQNALEKSPISVIQSLYKADPTIVSKVICNHRVVKRIAEDFINNEFEQKYPPNAAPTNVSCSNGNAVNIPQLPSIKVGA